MTLPYNDYGSAMRRALGGRVQKLAIDADMSCPNRDGTLGSGGCTFCLNDAFSPAYCKHSATITEQIERGIAFHRSRRRIADKYLAYFQTGSNTFAPINTLQNIYRKALDNTNISGIIVGTRPDCIDSEILDLLEHIAKEKYVAVEYGIESVYDATLNRVNRGHDFASAQHAVTITRERGIDVGAHFILGLPGESRADIVRAIATINTLGISSIKFHQLQIYRNTPIEREFRAHPEDFLFGSDYATEQYVSLMVDILRNLDPAIAVERFVSQAPHNLISHSPFGGIRPDKVVAMVVNKMLALGAVQGDMAQK
jgi:radical SAM protein (TIGR01212 family)